MKALPVLHAAGVGLSGAAVLALALQLAGASRRETAAVEAAATERTRAASELAETRARLAGELKRASESEQAKAAVRKELEAETDRLEHAYKDIAEMEKQLVTLSREKNDIEEQLKATKAELAQLKDHAIEVLPDHPPAPAIEGTVLGVSDRVNLVLISVGKKDNVEIGMTFSVLRGTDVVSRLMVDKIEDGWAACRELKDARKQQILEGDQVKQDLK